MDNNTARKIHKCRCARAVVLALSAALTFQTLGSGAPRVPAFPGAEGAGASTPGGRGGKVIEGTNLDDSGPGSFRAALETSGPRTVVFRVGGLITLTNRLRIAEPFISIAGPTAPCDGVCVRSETTESNSHDVIS